MAEVKAGQAMLRRGGVHLALGEGAGASGSACAENLTGVVGGLAECVGSVEVQLMPQLVATKIELQPVVVRVARVGPPANNALVAVHAADLRVNRLSRPKNRRRRSAWGQPRWNLTREVCEQAVNSRVAVDGLEQP